jgi:hypothetical protein
MGLAMNDSSRFIPESGDQESVEKADFSMQHCPVIQQANNVVRSSKETRRALRRLRQSLMNCETCPAFGKCELREQFSIQVDQAITQINEEWGW